MVRTRPSTCAAEFILERLNVVSEINPHDINVHILFFRTSGQTDTLSLSFTSYYSVWWSVAFLPFEIDP